MDTQRLILFLIFSFSLFLLFDAWQKEQRGPSAAGAVTDKQASSPAGKEAAVPPAKPAGDVPAASVPVKPPTQSLSVPDAGEARGQVLKVSTDVLTLEIDTRGGVIRKLEMPKHRDAEDTKKVLTLMRQAADHTYIAQQGLTGANNPNHHTLFQAGSSEFRLADGQDKLVVRMTSQGDSAVKVTKVLTLQRGSYLIDVTQEIENTGAEAVDLSAYSQFVRDGKAAAGDSAMLPTFTGVALYTEKDKFVKVTFPDIEKNKAVYPKSAPDGWIGVVQHYFVAAWLPQPTVPREFYLRKLDGGLFAAGVIVPVGKVAPGARASVSVPLYAGPQEQDKLQKLAPGLDLTVDYGWLTVIAVPLFWVLKELYGWVGNWGVAIILLTVLVKLIFYPLSAASYKSMAKMKVVAPRLQRMKEQYGDDRQRMHQAMMELYKTEKINPLGGCLPILVQIPVFIALYWVLLASVELRQAPFMLWITDLSIPDPFYILPVLMGATMIIQTKLNPEPPDPVQAKIMKIMPIAFSVFFFFFPAGLVLYWLVNNILSIAQQWQITRALEQASPGGAKR